MDVTGQQTRIVHNVLSIIISTQLMAPVLTVASHVQVAKILQQHACNVLQITTGTLLNRINVLNIVLLAIMLLLMDTAELVTNPAMDVMDLQTRIVHNVLSTIISTHLMAPVLTVASHVQVAKILQQHACNVLQITIGTLLNRIYVLIIVLLVIMLLLMDTAKPVMYPAMDVMDLQIRIVPNVHSTTISIQLIPPAFTVTTHAQGVKILPQHAYHVLQIITGTLLNQTLVLQFVLQVIILPLMDPVLLVIHLVGTAMTLWPLTVQNVMKDFI